MSENYLALSRGQKRLIIITVMLVAILEVLDSTIVNVALPSMMPALSASQDQITWVLTSYIVASAMVLPLTGFLSNRIGHKRLLLINITGFMISSFLCGLAQSLPEMVIFRLCQGAFGAALIPLSQSILKQSFPLKEQGKAMAIWGLGIMAAPVFGPTLGGYITEHANWRWIFYLNIPFCLLGIFLTLLVIPKAKTFLQKIDWLGVSFMFIGIGCLQLFLDQGNTKNWFHSNYIMLIATMCIFSLIVFMIRNATNKHPVIKYAIFKDRNFSVSTVLMALFCACIFGMITIQPIMLENLFGYTAVIAGLTMAPLGVASAVGMITASLLMNRINVKYLLITGILFFAAGAYHMAHLTLQASQHYFIISNLLQGMGLGIFMIPLSTYALATVNPNDINEGSGLFSYARMLGSSIGISLLSTLVSRKTQYNWHLLGAKINIYSSHLRTWLAGQHQTLQDPTVITQLSHTLKQQASLMAFIDAYMVIAITLIILIPLVLLLKRVNLSGMTQNIH